jgi:hypothetical protein
MPFDIKEACGGFAAVAIVASFTTFASIVPAEAGNVATRCGYDGCEAIHCNYTGDRCHHVDGDYDRVGYRDDYGYGYGRLVCDSDGDRCYRSSEPYWNYREYYRRHGYHWNGHGEARYYDRGYESDRLNREEYERARDSDRYDY